jgi:hypothetical protein
LIHNDRGGPPPLNRQSASPVVTATPVRPRMQSDNLGCVVRTRHAYEDRIVGHLAWFGFLIVPLSLGVVGWIIVAEELLSGDLCRPGSIPPR